MELGATLANDDGASADQLTAESFHTEHLGLGIAPVSRRAAAFFLCHVTCSLSLDRADLQFGELLTVTLAFLVVLATTHFENANLVMFAMRHDCGLDSCTGHQGRADFELCAVTHGKHLVDHDFLANVRSNLFYFNFFAGSNTVLFAAGFYDCVHKNLKMKIL
jgi:hypothetical protein